MLKGQLVAAEAMMTAEDLAKLSGTQSEISNLLNLDTEKRQNLLQIYMAMVINSVGRRCFSDMARITE